MCCWKSNLNIVRSEYSADYPFFLLSNMSLALLNSFEWSSEKEWIWQKRDALCVWLQHHRKQHLPLSNRKCVSKECSFNWEWFFLFYLSFFILVWCRIIWTVTRALYWRAMVWVWSIQYGEEFANKHRRHPSFQCIWDSFLKYLALHAILCLWCPKRATFMLFCTQNSLMLSPSACFQRVCWWRKIN